MLIFAGCKINIGLDVVARRADGYHDLSTLMFPVEGLCDAVEILPATDSSLSVVGNAVECEPQQNLCIKALHLMQRDYDAPQAHIVLHKVVPSGAGLGGGSSDAAAVIKGVNELFGLGLSKGELLAVAARLGSDIPFFIDNRPALASGRGEILSPPAEAILKQLAGKYLLIIKPPFGVSTAEAYAGITPSMPTISLSERLTGPVTGWRDTIANAFEPHIFKAYPLLTELKNKLYDSGAVYTSMSGSGSALYGIFDNEPQINQLQDQVFVYKQVIDL